MPNIDKAHRKLVENGENIYFRTCVTCHGPDGKGITVPGTDLMLAPSLVDCPRVDGDVQKLASILHHGLTGPLDGKTYQAGFMAPAAALGITRDDRLAEVLSFIRYAWSQEGGMVTKEDVAAALKRFADRKTPWTLGELDF